MKSATSRPAATLLGPIALTLSAFSTAQEVQPNLGLQHRAEGAFEGYTLINPLSSTKTLLVDMDGKVVHSWDSRENGGGLAYLLEDGSLVRSAVVPDNPRFKGGGMGGKLQRFSWDGELLWEFVMADDYQTLHHDIAPLPNGNFLAIAWEHRFREDAIAYGRDPKTITDKGMWTDAVYELKPLGQNDAEIVWEWHAWDHLIQDFDPDLEGHGSIPDHPELIDINADHRGQPPMSPEEIAKKKEIEEEMRQTGYAGGVDHDDGDTGGAPPDSRSTLPDWLHTNAIDYHAELDLIVLSTPNLNEIWVIDHSLSSDDAMENDGGRFGVGGGLLYRWGNPRNYGRGTSADRWLFYQHDPTWLGGAGELALLLFNNGQGRDGDYSSVEEIHLPFDAKKGFEREPGRSYGPDQPSWIYVDRGTFFSSFISGAQRLPNGNTLICEGAEGRVFEVTPEAEIVWDFLNPVGGDARTPKGQPSVPAKALFRATRVALDHPAVARLHAAR